jgi:hypothetical protein
MPFLINPKCIVASLLCAAPALAQEQLWIQNASRQPWELRLSLLGEAPVKQIAKDGSTAFLGQEPIAVAPGATVILAFPALPAKGAGPAQAWDTKAGDVPGRALVLDVVDSRGSCCSDLTFTLAEETGLPSLELGKAWVATWQRPDQLLVSTAGKHASLIIASDFAQMTKPATAMEGKAAGVSPAALTESEARKVQESNRAMQEKAALAYKGNIHKKLGLPIDHKR